MRIILFLFAVAFSLESFASTRIAFLETYGRDGRRIEYEPGGRFVHTAIQFPELGDQWVDAFPGSGVSVISLQTLQKRGVITAIIELPHELTLKDLTPYWERPFDFWYSWTDEAIYCSELIGKLLDIPTHPMKFNKDYWPKNYWHLEGTPGLSPDTVYHWALSVGGRLILP